jgi:hypothetical protein
MRCRYFGFILGIAISGARANGLESQSPLNYMSYSAPAAEATLEFAQRIPLAGGSPFATAAIGTSPAVAIDVKATSQFIHSKATKASGYTKSSANYDGWLMALAGAGLIVLQLRRKHKSLPQRPIVGYS